MAAFHPTRVAVLLCGTFFLSWQARVVHGQPPAARAERSRAHDLLAVPLPDTAEMEPVVKEQIHAAHEFLTSVSANPNVTDEELEAAFGDTGRIFHAYELRETADACYRNALQLNPNDFRWWHYRGLIHRSWARPESARSFFSRAVKLRPEHVPSIVHQAELFIEEGRLQEAEKLFRRALSLDPNGAAAWVGLGQVALLGKDYEGAIENLQTAIRLVPAATKLHYSLGLAYRGIGDSAKAVEHMKLRGPVGVKVSDPLADELENLQRGERIYLIRGRLAFQAGRFVEAAEAFEAAVRADPQSYRARVNLGTTFAALGDEEEAVIEFRRALEIYPDSVAAHFNLGHLLARDGLFAEAEEHLRAAVQRRPHDFEAQIELADVLKAQKAHEQALRHYREAVSLDATSERAYLGVIEILLRLGKFRSAGEQLEAAHRRFPDRGPTAHVLARFLAGCPDKTLRDGARSLELARRVFAARATSVHAETVAMAFAELGRCPDASQWQETAISLANDEGRSEILPRLQDRLESYQLPECAAP